LRRIIINADDFGVSEHTFIWTLKCFEVGVLSSATIMAGAAEFPRAVAFACANPQWSFGLHLVLSDEMPLSRPETIPSMVNREGRLWPTQIFILRSAIGLIRRTDLEHEIRAQFQRLRDAGIAISHLDGHGHLHRMPFVVRSLVRLKGELGIDRIRPAQDFYYTSSRISLKRWLNRAVNVSMRKHFTTPDHFLMTSGKVSSSQSNWFREMQPRLPEGCTEIGIHPGTDELWRRLDTDFLIQQGQDAFLQAGFQLVSYHELAYNSSVIRNG
jgi:predicted glycoside hydrolase/deacetylase ChbG (UPF0249 family)